jgi:monofunctional biosynthetic peptidoglycan transglycosylase
MRVLWHVPWRALAFIWRWSYRFVLVTILLLLGYHLWIFGHIYYWIDHNPASSSFMRARLDVMREKNPDANLRHEWIAYNGISRHMKRAIVAAEDARFVEHEGFDWEGIQKAIEKNQKKGRIVAGGSTISQQLAKNLFLSPNKSYLRKAEEAVITIMLESMMSKDRILELYLNVVEWGDGLFGVQAAAKRYYNSSAGNLTPLQAARLAAMLPNPRFFEKNRNSRDLNRRTFGILRRMSRVEIP